MLQVHPNKKKRGSFKTLHRSPEPSSQHHYRFQHGGCKTQEPSTALYSSSPLASHCYPDRFDQTIIPVILLLSMCDKQNNDENEGNDDSKVIMQSIALIH